MTTTGTSPTIAEPHSSTPATQPHKDTPASAFDNIFSDISRFPRTTRLSHPKAKGPNLPDQNLLVDAERTKERTYDVNLVNTQMPPYEPLMDEHLQDYFNSPITRSHLIRLGLIDMEGNIIDAKIFKFNQIQLDKKAYEEALRKKQTERELDQDIELAIRIQSQTQQFRVNKIGRSDDVVPPYPDFFERFPISMHKTALLYSEKPDAILSAEHMLLERLRDQPPVKLKALGVTRTEIENRLKRLEQKRKREYELENAKFRKQFAQTPHSRPTSSRARVSEPAAATGAHNSTTPAKKPSKESSSLVAIFELAKSEYEAGHLEAAQTHLRRLLETIRGGTGSSTETGGRQASVLPEIHLSPAKKTVSMASTDPVASSATKSRQSSGKTSSKPPTPQKTTAGISTGGKLARPKSARPTRNSRFPTSSDFSDFGSESGDADGASEPFDDDSVFQSSISRPSSVITGTPVQEQSEPPVSKEAFAQIKEESRQIEAAASESNMAPLPASQVPQETTESKVEHHSKHETASIVDDRNVEPLFTSTSRLSNPKLSSAHQSQTIELSDKPAAVNAESEHIHIQSGNDKLDDGRQEALQQPAPVFDPYGLEDFDDIGTEGQVMADNVERAKQVDQIKESVHMDDHEQQMHHEQHRVQEQQLSETVPSQQTYDTYEFDETVPASVDTTAPVATETIAHGQQETNLHGSEMHRTASKGSVSNVADKHDHNITSASLQSVHGHTNAMENKAGEHHQDFGKSTADISRTGSKHSIVGTSCQSERQEITKPLKARISRNQVKSTGISQQLI
eukprot:jgi/Hompol1/1526/HPOL_005620-RA